MNEFEASTRGKMVLMSEAFEMVEVLGSIESIKSLAENESTKVTKEAKMSKASVLSKATEAIGRITELSSFEMGRRRNSFWQIHRSCSRRISDSSLSCSGELIAVCMDMSLPVHHRV
jgi:hypothetical protein